MAEIDKSQLLKSRLSRLFEARETNASRVCLLAGLSKNALGNALKREGNLLSLRTLEKICPVLSVPTSALSLEMSDDDFEQLLTNKSPDEQTASALKSARERQGLSVSELAATIGKEEDFVKKVEAGEASISANTLIEFLSALNLSASDLAPEAHHQPAAPSTEMMDWQRLRDVLISYFTIAGSKHPWSEADAIYEMYQSRLQYDQKEK